MSYIDSMRVAHVASEVFPFSRSGGLGDVLGVLPATLAAQGEGEVLVVSPWYASLSEQPQELWRGHLSELPAEAGEVRVGEIVRLGVRYLFIGLPEFDRPGLYHNDDVWRFCMFGRAVLPVLRQLHLWPTLLHGHDWQAGLVVAHAHLAGLPAVFTIHNLQYQGRWNLGDGRYWTALPDWAYDIHGLEYYGDINLMKAGLVYARMVTTVSPTYAREITSVQFGEGLEGLLTRLSQEGRLSGILNGLDQDRWNPRHDPEVVPYRDWVGKAGARQALKQEFGLDDKPVLGAVSRLADQKGMDLLIEAFHQLVADWNIVILGGGDPLLVAALEGWAQHPRVRFVLGMNEPLSHRIYAGADAFAMPSRFEPCGLSQMIALRYGTVPIVRETGGLVDTVPHDVGFHFEEASAGALAEACGRARQAFADEAAWSQRVERAMSLDFSWGGPAKQYRELYQKALG